MLYIFTKKATLLTLDLNTTHLHTTALSKVNPERFRTIRPYSYKVENFDVSTRLFLPSLSTGSTLQEGLAEHLDMKIFVGKNFSKSKYMCYSAFIEIMLDKNGNAKLVKIDYNNHLPENRIREFIESEIFSTGDIPLFTDKWRFKDWINLMNKNPEEAELEKQKEIQEKQEALKKRIVADSIDGQYIPKNLEKCFLELNKLLKQKDISAIRKLKNSGETIDYHHGLGTWLRNNWGLWAGSRLQQYLIGKGIYHPDDMSGTILELYQEWLTNKHDNWKELEAKPLQIRRDNIPLKTEVKTLARGINVQIQKMK